MSQISSELINRIVQAPFSRMNDYTMLERQLAAEVDQLRKERIETEKMALRVVPPELCIAYCGNAEQYISAAITKLQLELDRLKGIEKLHNALMRRRSMNPQMDSSHICEVELIKVKERVHALESFAKDVRDNYDCDTGANGEHFPEQCRVCKSRRMFPFTPSTRSQRQDNSPEPSTSPPAPQP